MKTPRMTSVKRWTWAMIPAFALAVGVAVAQVPSLFAQTAPEERADPLQFGEGKLDQAAVEEASGFDAFPVVWLGEDFRGYKLTWASRENYSMPGGIVVDRMVLVYGTCEKPTGENSCVPPLAIVVFAPGTIPGPGGIPEPAKASVGAQRGVTTAELSGSTTLWIDGGVAIQIQSNEDLRDEIIGSLELANGQAIGLDDIGPGASLSPLSNLGERRNGELHNGEELPESEGERVDPVQTATP